MTKQEYLFRVLTGTDTEQTYIELMESGVGFGIVPEKYQTDKVCFSAIQRVGNIPLIPEKYKAKNIWDYLLFLDNSIFENTPDEFKTPEICVAAVQKDPRNFTLCPKELQTYELATITVQSHTQEALGCIPKELIDRELCLKAVRTSPMSFEFVPKEYIDKEMVKAAVYSSNTQWCYRWVFSDAEDFLDRELCLRIVEVRSHFVKNLPKRILTPDFLMEAVQKNPYVVCDIPDELKTDELYMAAYSVDPSVIRMFPEHLITKELIRKALIRDSYCVSWAVKHVDDPDFFLEVVKEKPDLLYYFPKPSLNMFSKVFEDEGRKKAFLEWTDN